MKPSDPVAPTATAGGHRSRGEPLTWAQRLLWTGQRLHSGAPLYNMVLAWDMRGALDHGRFRQAFQSVVDRSDALRSVFHEEQGAPVVIVLPSLPVTIEMLDLSSSTDPLGRADSWMEARARRILDPTRQLFECALLQVAEDRHIWYLNQHHLITDAWSTGLLFRYVAEEYERLSQEAPAPARSLPAYREFAQFLEDVRDSRAQVSARVHWQEVKSRSLGPTALYGRRGARAERASTRTERLTLELGAQRSDAIREMARSPEARSLTEHASKFNVFAALVLGFAARVSGQERVALGAPAHNRAKAVFKDTLGVFIEVFPLQAEVHADTTFAELLGSVRSEAASFLRFAQPGTSDATLNRSVNVVLNYINATFSDFAGLESRSRWIHSGHGDSAHDLRVQVHDFDDDDSFVIHLDLSAERFDAEERDLAATHFLAFVDAALASPQAPLGDLSLLDDDEVQSLAEMARVAADPKDTASAPRTVLEAFRAQVEADPNRTALVSGTAQWSYGELQRQAIAVARELRRIDVRGRTVVLALPRSAEAVIATLGIIEAGGAYVPVDPDTPPDRLRYIVETSVPAAIVGQTAVDFADIPSVSVAVGNAASPAEVDAWIAEHPVVEDGDRAYVLFTSGSTGQPKGVMVEHGSLAHYAQWAAREYLQEGADSMALFTPLTFDLTVTSIFAPLVGGGTVVVYDDPGGAVDLSVLDVFSDDAVDVVKLTPSHLELVVDLPNPPSRIRTLILGGEDLRTDLARAAAEFLPNGSRIINEYGPTEATVACTLHEFDPERDLDPSVPIGRPIPGATIELLDREGRLAPTGVPGEICVGGPGVARGYLQSHPETEARFGTSSLTGGRMYKTGDLGRWRSDGTLEYHGRLDRQFKINGVRMEPAEIEAALVEHPAVRQALVLAMDPDRPAAAQSVTTSDVNCVRCGMPSSHPDTVLDSDGVCSICISFEAFQDGASEYFGSMDELHRILRERARAKTGPYDCLLLLSGGKDSSYALCRLVEMGLRVLTVTLDNGFISEGAKENIRRVTGELGVTHEFVTSDAMNEIFVDSLERFSNVCQGCFKTMYTLAFNMALARGIPSIVTGLSRGQFFETRLTEELFLGSGTTRQGLELMVLDARKAYHRTDDFVNRTLDTRAFAEDESFERVVFVDFYRYCDVQLDEMLAYLDEKAPWIRPADTGRSTNCLINDVGIYVHKLERGFHNYALPYSWDVRLGHKERDAALDELDDEIDAGSVEKILGDIGYVPKVAASVSGKRLTAFFTGDEGASATELRGLLGKRLPTFMIPSRFVRVDEIPITKRGKADVAALERLAATGSARTRTRGSDQPRSNTERTLSRLWSTALQFANCGIDVNFFDAGGDSITAIRVAARASAEGLHLTPNDIFRQQTIRELARVVDDHTNGVGDPMSQAQGAQPTASVREKPTEETLAKIAALLDRADAADPAGPEDG